MKNMKVEILFDDDTKCVIEYPISKLTFTRTHINGYRYLRFTNISMPTSDEPPETILDDVILDDKKIISVKTFMGDRLINSQENISSYRYENFLNPEDGTLHEYLEFQLDNYLG